MKDFVYTVLSLGEYMVRALLLLKIFRVWLPLKKSFEKTGKYILCIQCVVTQYLLSETRFFKKLLYGESMVVDLSIKSAISILLCAFVTFCFSLWLFEGKKSVKAYLVANFYTMLELTRFAWYSLCVPLLDLMSDSLVDKALEGKITLQQVEIWICGIEFFWNLLVSAGSCILLYLVVKWYCGTAESMEKKYSKEELLFLAFPSITGFIFCVFLRGILYSQSETEIRFLFEDYPGARILVIVLTLLLLGTILVSIRAFAQLVKRHEEKSRLVIYENQIEEMVQHVKDMENLYDGIRGMRHDMKNNIYAMEILLKEDPGEKDARTHSEACKYLMQMNEALDGLDYPVQSGNPITDVVIGRIFRECQKEKVGFQCDFRFPGNKNFPVFDICVLLNNALDNAVEACVRLKETEGDRKKIHLRSYEKRNLFFIEIENGFNGRIYRNAEGGFLSTKEEPETHGIGIGNMRKCVEKYFGRIEFSIEDGYFTTKIMLQDIIPKHVQ